MRAHPEMVGGTGREDTRLMQAIPGLLVKGGAEGVHCAALPDGRCIAVKITDGGDRARMPVLVGALRLLGVGAGNAAATALLDELGTGVVLGAGAPVGTVEVAPGSFRPASAEVRCGGPWKLSAPAAIALYDDSRTPTHRAPRRARRRRVGVGSEPPNLYC